MTGRRRTTGLFGMPQWTTLGVLALLLLGVLAMHGLASHYVAGDGHSEVGATANILDTSSPVGMSQPDPCDCHAEQVVVPAGGGHTTATGLLTLCMAVLVGIAVLLIVALVATRRSALPRWTPIHRSNPSGSAVRTRPLCISYPC